VFRSGNRVRRRHAKVASFRRDSQRSTALRRLYLGPLPRGATDSPYRALIRELRSSFDLAHATFGENRLAATEKDRYLLAYGARSLMEIAMSALVARLDPFRVLVLRNCQLSSDYDIGSRAESAISWTGDVYTKDDKAVNWSRSLKPANVSRAVLDSPWGEIAWAHAYQEAIDYIRSDRGVWVSELRSKSSEAFFSNVRGRLLSLYSSYSKGVHNELLIPKEIRLDESTLKSNSNDLVKCLAMLGYVSNFIDHTSTRFAMREAAEAFKLIQDSEAEA